MGAGDFGFIIGSSLTLISFISIHYTVYISIHYTIYHYYFEFKKVIKIQIHSIMYKVLIFLYFFLV